MNKITLIIILSLVTMTGICQTSAESVYNIKPKGISGNDIDMASFKGKKILIVNIASGSERVSQYAELKQLSQQYKDSLVIICFPSDDFNNEKKTDEQLQDFFSGTNSRLLLAKKIAVKGDNISPLYEWLTKKNKNGVGDVPVKGDFQKFLISKEGKLIAYFSGMASPVILERALKN